MIYATSGKPGSGMTLTPPWYWDKEGNCHLQQPGVEYTAADCTPPVENSEAPGASGAEDGQGVCILTIDREYSRMYVDGVVRSYRSAALLKAAYVKSTSRTGFDPEKCTPYALALWDGYWAVLQELNAFIRNAANHGVLLHLVPA